MDDGGLEFREDHAHDMTEGSRYDDTYDIDLHMDHLYSLSPEPGPSCIPHIQQVFEMAPDNGSEEDEEAGESYNDTYVEFLPDIESVAEGDNDDNEVHGFGFEDLPLTVGEGAHRLQVEQELDRLGAWNIYVLVI